MKLRKKTRLFAMALLCVGMLFTSVGCSQTTGNSSDTTSAIGADATDNPDANTGFNQQNGPEGMTGGFGDPGGNGGPEGTTGGPGSKGGMMGGGALDKSGDTELQDMISEVQDKFTTAEYSDSETGLTVPYNIFLPENYDASKTYPMVVFIGDASTVGTDMAVSITQGWGGVVWATEAEQAKHEAIVMIPVFPSVVIDDNNGENKTDYLNLIPRMVTYAAEKYHADTNRIYGIGQSMGAMATMYTAANNTDLYAGTLIVDGQWNTDELAGIESQNMVYVAAGGDQKAAQGQADVKVLLDSLGTKYSQASGWDAQADATDLASKCEALFEEGNSINFITWEAGTVLNGESGSEHMASFDYAYKLDKVRDWLFEQTK